MTPEQEAELIEKMAGEILRFVPVGYGMRADEAEQYARAALSIAKPIIRADALEEAAKAAEGIECEAAGDEYKSGGNGNFWDNDSIYGTARIDVARSIRALKSKGQKPS